MIKIMKPAAWIFISLSKALLKYEKKLKLFKKQTNQTHREYMAFLSIRMASFHQKMERWKALEGRDKKVWPQQVHSPELRLPSLPQRGAETQHILPELSGILELLWRGIPCWNTDKRATKCGFLICFFLPWDKQLFLHAEVQEWGAEMSNTSGSAAFRDCLCRENFVCYT